LTRARKRTQTETRLRLHGILSAIDRSVEAYKSGQPPEWWIWAGHLCVLLCDRPRGASPVVERVMPDITFHPLIHDASRERRKYLLYIPSFHFDEHGERLDLFDFNAHRIPLSEWLTQTVTVLGVDGAALEITLEKLIRDLRNQEGAGHLDDSVGETVQATRGFRLTEKGRREPFHVKALLAIAEYVVPEIRTQLAPHDLSQVTWRS